MVLYIAYTAYTYGSLASFTLYKYTYESWLSSRSLVLVNITENNVTGAYLVMRLIRPCVLVSGLASYVILVACAYVNCDNARN